MANEPTTDSCIESAIVYAAQKHQGQLGRDGYPYIFHPLRVLEHVHNDTDELVTQMVAVLHDVVEDTDATLEEIELYFGKDVAEGVDAITRRDGEDYFKEYISRVSTNKHASLVKYYDCVDHLSYPGFFRNNSEVEKYTQAMMMVDDAINRDLKDNTDDS